MTGTSRPVKYLTLGKEAALRVVKVTPMRRMNQGRKAVQFDIETLTDTCTHRSIVSESGSCCSKSDPKNQHITVSLSWASSLSDF